MNPSDSSSAASTREPAEVLVLDACVLLNLCASGRIADVLSAAPRSLVSSYVSREALWYLAPVDPLTGRVERREVALGPLLAARLVEVVELTPEESRTFITLARDLGDGEAASGAIAAGRSATVATDDRKARHVFARHLPPIVTISTAALLHAWEAHAAVAPADVAATIDAIRVRARFEPRKNDPDADWWRDRKRSAIR